MPSPTAVLQMRINGGPVVTGGQTIQPGDVVAFTAASFAGWASPAAYYEFPAGTYPIDWPCPDGWEDVDGNYRFTVSAQAGFTPPDVTFPSEVDVGNGLWGTWLPRLVVNGTIVDETCGLEIESPHGFRETAAGEAQQFGGAARGFILKDQNNIRVSEQVAAGALDVPLSAVAPPACSAAAGVLGADSFAAHGQHTHQITTGAPVDIGTANAIGAGTAVAVHNHVHKLPFSTVQTVLAGASGAIAVNGQKITGLANGTAAQDAATVAQLSAAINGLDLKAEVRGASLGNQSLSGALVEDGITYQTDDRYLAKNQTDPTQNGIYDVDVAGAWSRSGDMDTDAEFSRGAFCFVMEGTTNQKTGWAVLTGTDIVVGTTAITFTQIYGPGTPVAGAGLSQTGNTFNVGQNADNSIVVNANDIQVGVISDAQHGTRGGGTTHANAVAGAPGTAGFMTGVQAAAVDGATATPTADKIAKYDASKNLAAAKFNGEGTTSTAGVLNTTKNVTQVAAKNNGGSADMSLVSTDSSDKTIFGDVTNGASADLIAKLAGFVRKMVGTFVASHSTSEGTSFGMAPSFGGGIGMLGLANATTEPTTAPTGGIDFYAFAGAFKAWTPKVLRTTLAAETNGAATDQRIDRIHQQVSTGDAASTPIFTWELPNLASQAVFDVLISGIEEGSDARVSFHIYVSVSRNAGNAVVDGSATVITIVDTITVAGVPTVDVTGTSARFNVRGKNTTNIDWRISGTVDYFCP